MKIKCTLYLVNGLNINLFDAIKSGRNYIGKTEKGIKKVINESDVNAVGGDYKEIIIIKRMAKGTIR